MAHIAPALFDALLSLPIATDWNDISLGLKWYGLVALSSGKNTDNCKPAYKSHLEKIINEDTRSELPVSSVNKGRR